MPTDAEVRAKIASVALAYVGSQAWVDSVAKENYPANTNKCNLFVYDILTQAGATPGLPHGHWFWHRYPPNAGEHVPRPSALGPRPLGPEVFRRYDSTVR